MAITNPVTAQDLGRAFAEMVRAEPAARQLWVRHHLDTYELWLVTDSIDADRERSLYGVEYDLQTEFPGVVLDLTVLNSRYYPSFDPAEYVPAGAEEIPVRDQ